MILEKESMNKTGSKIMELCLSESMVCIGNWKENQDVCLECTGATGMLAT